MVVLYVLIALVVVGLLTGVHWYVWRRLVGDTTARGGWARRAGTAAAFVLPLMSVGAVISGRAGAPFPLQRALAWPGYLWLALLLYLTLALLVGEAVRPLLGAWLGRRKPAEPADVRSAEGPAAGAEVAAAAGRTVDDGSAATAVAPAPSAVRTAADAPAAVAVEPATDETAEGVAAESAAQTVEAAETAAKAAATDRPAGLPPAASRRLFVARAVAVGATAVAAGTVGYGTYTVLRGPRVKRITVPLAKLPRRAHGFRIAVVSDIHLGPILGRAHTQRVVEAVNRTGPDLIAVVGDLVDGSVADLGPAAEPLRALRARHGSYFVTGNHEYYSGADAWVDHVRELGLRPLENERTELPGFDLAGVNDVAGESEGRGPDVGKALGGRDRSRASVLLAHQPVVIHDAVKAGVDLQLSGHTHGGQLWPGTYVAELANPTAAGLERYGDTQLYVTRGAGAWGPPVRVGAPPDVTVVELASTRT
ncbi:metallophosphoesterase [Streptomyces sp. PSAA01]|uniref:metallophosphoesterase n=1 Tax=Streptomyces sp. PSAA01 TaxID=2912762 RepID=UPI001F1DC775|nr:metallophosphoesterase [Streptomyces sp. PSAA01]MCG0288121.1 metallophosphoesterase [Streptomyces sp. PSAA01]